ncbi:hypothetical protein RS84_02869 [Microbacterium hydrocarbonoxydans]|uniref:Uncharacterized protein n=1 Tax=Microbacterium hydrocarbonoxydans TaxID=273678 RepID=A0A0M2HP53_9MICO|nr:hypothetical protein [Microbacterium hydrocarbonoxydans]KJL46242.1 hypothetical protein RS84_02869 [Microbacterium hydrocarbonoxydans]
MTEDEAKEISARNGLTHDGPPRAITRTDLKTMTPQQIMTHLNAGDLEVLLGRATADTTSNDTE